MPLSVAVHAFYVGPKSAPDDTIEGEGISPFICRCYVDNQFDPGYDGDGILVNGARNLIMRDNVIEVAPLDPIRNERCGVVEYLDNRTPASALLPRVDPVTGKEIEELDAAAEDALTVSLYEKM